MAFSKGHYEKLATVLQQTKPDGSYNTNEAIYQWEFTRNKLAEMLAVDSGAFKRDRFIRACEPGNNVKARS